MLRYFYGWASPVLKSPFILLATVSAVEGGRGSDAVGSGESSVVECVGADLGNTASYGNVKLDVETVKVTETCSCHTAADNSDDAACTLWTVLELALASSCASLGT